nr:hypothetical protein B0A51_01842 [Rachicladosporium sp. CCFEE 5018]
MARSHLLRNTISISILSIIILVATSWTFRGSLLWRKVIYYPSHLVRPYQAPMLGCENLNVIEGSYCVFLHHGSKLERHIQTIGNHVDWSPTIRHLFPETTVHSLYYCAHDVDDAALKASRADIAVDVVDCDWPLVAIPDRIEVELWDANLSAWVPEQPSSSQFPSHSSTPPVVQSHRAPLAAV